MKSLANGLVVLAIFAGCSDPQTRIDETLQAADEPMPPTNQTLDSAQIANRSDGIRAGKSDQPDRMIHGVVTEISPNYKIVTIRLNDPKAKVEAGDIFRIFMREDEYLKVNRHSPTAHKDHPTADVKTVSVAAGIVTAEIDHGTIVHHIGVGDRAIARGF